MRNAGGKLNNKYTVLSSLLFGLVMVGCDEPKTFIPTNTDYFVYDSQDLYQQASLLLQADYVIVPDFSYSMADDKDSLEQALNDFANHLETQNIDYKVGIIRGTTQHAGFYLGAIPSSFLGSILTPNSGSTLRAQVAAKLAELGGPNAPNVNLALESTRKTMASKASGFLREAAQLVYVFISDGDDRSHQTINGVKVSNRSSVANYVDDLSAYKSNPDYINARSFVITGEAGCEVQEDSYEDEGTRLAAVANALDANGDGTRCIYDHSEMSDALENLAVDVSRPTNRFKVQSQAYASSIVVSVEGTPVASSASTWTYNAASNEIIFDPAAQPALSEQLEINFEPVLKLSRAPIESTLVVKVNGNTVPRDASNGYSYNSSTKELRFHGSFVPSHNSNVTAKYEVQ